MNNNNSYCGVQSLRFFAALLVVFTHATGMYAERVEGLSGENFWRAGMAGVDIFFVISGFVMCISGQRLLNSANSWGGFLVRRIIRIVPMYWCATILKIGLVVAFPMYVLNSPLDLRYLVSSFLFLPYFDAFGNMLLPMLKVGWTLNYEMFFYCVFAVSLACSASPFRFITIVFLAVSLLNIVGVDKFDLVNGFFNPLVLEFTMGMAIANFLQRPNYIGLAKWSVIIIFSFFVIVYCQDFPIWWRWVFWGVPAAFIVAATVLAEEALSSSFFALFRGLGNSSYSLYLFHTFVVPAAGVGLVKLGISHKLLVVGVAVLLSILVGYLFFLFLERPVTRRLNAMVRDLG